MIADTGPYFCVGVKFIKFQVDMGFWYLTLLAIPLLYCTSDVTLEFSIAK